MDEFPKWVYHATEPAQIVADRDAQDALGEEWAETPAAFEVDSADQPVAPKRGRPKKAE